MVHAEANALLNTNTSNIAGATIYVTMIPCNNCAKLLIQAGVAEVVYFEVREVSRCDRAPLASSVVPCPTGPLVVSDTLHLHLRTSSTLYLATALGNSIQSASTHHRVPVYGMWVPSPSRWLPRIVFDIAAAVKNLLILFPGRAVPMCTSHSVGTDTSQVGALITYQWCRGRT